MSRLSIYLKKDLKQKVVSAAKAKNISSSKWLVKIIEKELNDSWIDDSWPENIRQMAGSWLDFPSQEEIRNEPTKALNQEINIEDEY